LLLPPSRERRKEGKRERERELLERKCGSRSPERVGAQKSGNFRGSLV